MVLTPDGMDLLFSLRSPVFEQANAETVEIGRENYLLLSKKKKKFLLLEQKRLSDLIT